jgi:hypothetical protein
MASWLFRQEILYSSLHHFYATPLSSVRLVGFQVQVGEGSIKSLIRSHYQVYPSIAELAAFAGGIGVVLGVGREVPVFETAARVQIWEHNTLSCVLFCHGSSV